MGRHRALNSSAFEKVIEASAGHDVVYVDSTGLRNLKARPPLLAYLRQLWQRRHFILAEAKSKALGEGRDMFLGNIWIILNPLLQVAVYTIVFGMILNVSRGMDNFIGFLIIGVIYFGFISKGIGSGSTLIRSSRSMISAFSFPKASLVLSSTLRQFFDNIAPAVVGVIAAVLFQIESIPTWPLLTLIPLLFLISIFNAGVTFFVARLTAFVPDFKGIVNLVNRALFFASGIFFPLTRFESHPTLMGIMEANPVHQFLSIARMAVLDNTFAPVGTWLYVIAWSVVLFVVGLIYFWQAEARYSSVK